MTINVRGVLADAWGLWKRDRDLLLGVLGLFVFLPQFAVLLLVPLPPDFPGLADEKALLAWFAAYQLWSSAFSGWILGATLVAAFGLLVTMTLYLARGRPDTGSAMVSALSLSPRYLLAIILVAIPVQFGLLLILPGLYVQGRLMLVEASLVAERPLGVFGAFSRSIALTRGLGLPLMGLACITLLTGAILSMPFEVLGKALDGAPMANPVMGALLDSAAAAGMAIGKLVAVLIQVALYRRLTESSRGI